MASQIHDSEIGHDNPAIQPLIDKILPDISPVLKRDQNPELQLSDLRIGELAGAAEYYIIHVVRLLLDRDPTMLDHLKPIGDACRGYPSSIRFYQALQNAEYLVICGYGCGDAGINARIAGWMNGADDRRVVVIDKKTETEYPNGVILRNWSNWKEKGQLEYFGDGIKADMWQEIKDGLGINTPKS